MKKFLAGFLLCAAAASASAQVTCGPYAPFARFINYDASGTEVSETVSMNASCENTDPAVWDHTYTFIFPSTLTYLDGTVLQYVGNPSAFVEGHNDCVGRYVCQHRHVTVDNAILTDPAGNVLPLAKVELGTRYPIDEWMTTPQTQMSPDVQYSLEASGTNNVPSFPGIKDVFHVQATYVKVTPPAPICGDGCDRSSR